MGEYNLVLYYSHTCGFCTKVLRFMEANHIDIPMKNIKDSSDSSEELRTLSGGIQVPALVINGKPLLESDAILEWLKNNMM